MAVLRLVSGGSGPPSRLSNPARSCGSGGRRATRGSLCPPSLLPSARDPSPPDPRDRGDRAHRRVRPRARDGNAVGRPHPLPAASRAGATSASRRPESRAAALAVDDCQRDGPAGAADLARGRRLVAERPAAPRRAPARTATVTSSPTPPPTSNGRSTARCCPVAGSSEPASTGSGTAATCRSPTRVRERQSSRCSRAPCAAPWTTACLRAAKSARRRSGIGPGALIDVGDGDLAIVVDARRAHRPGSPRVRAGRGVVPRARGGRRRGQRLTSAAAASAAIASVVASASPFASVTPVAPKPTTGISAASAETQSERASRARDRLVREMSTAQPPLASRQSMIDRDVEAVDAGGDDARPGGERREASRIARACRRRSARRPTPRASATRSRRGPGRRSARRPPRRPSARRRRPRGRASPRPQSIANGMPQTLPDGVVSGVLKSPWASNQAIANRRSGRAAPQAGHRPGVGRAVAAEDQRAASPAPGARERLGDERRARAAGTRRSGRGSSPAGRRPAEARLDRRGRRRRRAPSAASALARSRSTSPSAAQPGSARAPCRRGGRRARSARRASDDRGGDGIGMTRRSSGIIGPCASPTSPSSATSPAGSSRSTTCCARPTSRAGRWPSCWSSPTTRPPRCGAGLRLGYTESTGHPLLRAEIAELYEHVEPDDVLVFAGAEEAIFCLDDGHARAGRSRRRHVARLPEPVRGRAGGRRGGHAPRAARGAAAGRSTSSG